MSNNNVKESKRMVNAGRRSGTMQHRLRFATKKPTTVLPPIQLPYPPSIDAEKLVSKISSKKVLARFPNAFIIYRNEYVNFLKSKGFHLSMTELSPMISRSWKQEPEYVKDTYTRLSLQAEKLYLRRGSEQQQQISQFFNSERFYQANGPYLSNFTHRQLVEFALSQQQHPFFDHPQIHGRTNAARRISLPNAGPIMHSASIYPPIPQMRAPQDREIDQVFACSASTSPTMELTEDFAESRTNVNDFTGRDESTPHLMSNNLSSLLSFESPSLVQTCNLLATQNSNSNIPIVRVPSTSDNNSDSQRRNSSPNLLPSLTNQNCQLVQPSYPFSISFENEAWDDTPSTSLSKSQQQQQQQQSFGPSEEQQEICKFEIDENAMAFNEYHMNYFDTLNSDSAHSIKLPSSNPMEVFDNYSSGVLADFSPMVSS